MHSIYHKQELLNEGVILMSKDTLTEEQSKRLDVLVGLLWYWYGTCLVSYYVDNL